MTILLMLAVITISACGTVFIGNEVAISDAQHYLEHIIPMLDEHKASNGVYPTSLSLMDAEVTKLGDQPRLIFHPNLFDCQHEVVLSDSEKIIVSDFDRNYRSDGNVYELCFHAHDSWDTTGTIKVYYSEHKKWGRRVSYGWWDIGQGISID